MRTLYALILAVGTLGACTPSTAENKLLASYDGAARS